MAAGVTQAYVDDDLGPFAQDLVRQLTETIAQP